MAHALLLLVALLAQPSTPAWYPSRNYPAWEGFGIPHGDYLIPERWRRIADRSVELLPDGAVIVEATAPAEDPYGFTAWLNSTRAAYGLSAVSWHEDMVLASAANNSLQVLYGMGHHTMGGARRQNAAQMAYPALLTAWLNSPGHRAALLDPSIVHVGIAFAGAFCTFSAR